MKNEDKDNEFSKTISLGDNGEEFRLDNLVNTKTFLENRNYQICKLISCKCDRMCISTENNHSITDYFIKNIKYMS